MNNRGQLLTYVAVAAIAYGVFSLAAQDPHRCANVQSLKECIEQYAHNYAPFDTADFREWGKAVEKADYHVSDTCADVADLINKTKATAKRTFTNPNSMGPLRPAYFIWGQPMLIDTVINPPDTSYWSLYGSHSLLYHPGLGKTIDLIMVEDSLSDGPKFEALMHELTHAADTSASETDIEKVEACVERRPDKEKPKPKPRSGGGFPPPNNPGPGIEYDHGYCEYEWRVYCDRDEDGETQDPCYWEWVLIYCTILS